MTCFVDVNTQSGLSPSVGPFWFRGPEFTAQTGHQNKTPFPCHMCAVEVDQKQSTSVSFMRARRLLLEGQRWSYRYP